MILEENTKGAEIPAPKIKHIRAHHIINFDDGKPRINPLFIHALFGNLDEQFLFDLQDSLRYLVHQDKEDVNDVLGTETPTSSDTSRILDAKSNHYAEISLLPDGAILSIGVAKDGICESCAIGRHCIRRDSPNGDLVHTESTFQHFLLRFMQKNVPGLQEGPDFSWVTETVPLEKAGKIEMTEVQQLHVKVGILRQTFRRLA